LNYLSQKVSLLPLSNLIFGFANGWATGLGENTMFFEAKDIDTAYKNLAKAGTPLCGFMYWVIGEEGKNGVYSSFEQNTEKLVAKAAVQSRENNLSLSLSIPIFSQNVFANASINLSSIGQT
jgi:hypothetical protein